MAILATLGATGPAAGAGANDARLRVFAAASLTSAFGEIAREFERARPGVTVETNFAGSPTLVQQIREGAPADVFAAADEANMARVSEAKLTGGAPRVFARNRLAIAVEPGNPKGIKSLADLARPGLIVALAGPTVPVGRYAREAFAKAGVAVPESSQEIDVKAVVQKVALGEADAGLVYATDGAGAKIELVPIAESQNAIALYPIVILAGAKDRATADAFVEFVLGTSAQAVLRRLGFLGP